jgi:hypothetical protein
MDRVGIAARAAERPEGDRSVGGDRRTRDVLVHRRPAAVIALQRAAGNRAVTRVLMRRTTTQPPSGATTGRSGAATITLNGVVVTIKPDGTQGSGGTFTEFNVSTSPRPSFRTTNGVVSSVTQPVVRVSIQTKWAPGDSPSDSSAYGRGTTQDDINAGNTSLGFHESCHGADFLQYITSNAPSTYGVNIGDAADDANQATRDYSDAISAWSQAIRDYSTAQTDQVGTPGSH